MKREYSPYNPYKRKAKGKETNPDMFVSLQSPRACVRTRRDPFRKQCEDQILEEALVEFHGTRGPRGTRCDQNLWGGFIRKHGYMRFKDCVDEARSEIRQKRRTPPDYLMPRILQRILNRCY